MEHEPDDLLVGFLILENVLYPTRQEGISPAWGWIRENIPDGPVRRALKAMKDERICGIPALVERKRSCSAWGKELIRFLNFVYTLAQQNTSPVIIGESGTGKESMARVLHHLGSGSDKSFEAINCKNLSAELLEDTLFGHVSGAYTGAVKEKSGLIEMAEGGTIFLDELAKADAGIQYKLLRVIQHKEFYRVGGVVKIKVPNVRFVVAVQQEELKEGKLMVDFVNRLNLRIAIQLPTLNERLRRDPYLVYGVLRKVLSDWNFDERFRGAAKFFGENPGEASTWDSVVMKLYKPVMEAWEDNFRYRINFGEVRPPVILSDRAFNKMIKYSYKEQNFRGLEHLLEEALMKTTGLGEIRRVIQTSDLPGSDEKLTLSASEEIRSKEDIDASKIPLSQIMGYANNLRSRLVIKRVEQACEEGNLKTVLKKELGERYTDKAYNELYQFYRRHSGRSLPKMKLSSGSGHTNLT